MDEEHCIVCSESFENDLDPAILYLTDLTCTSVTNNWVVYQIEGTVVVKKATWTYQHHTMWMDCWNKKGIGSILDPFGTGAYTGSNKCPVGLATRD